MACLPLLVKHLRAKSHVVHSYSANCLEKLFTLKKPGGGTPYVFIFVLPLFFVVLNFSNVFTFIVMKYSKCKIKSLDKIKSFLNGKQS